MKSKLLLFTFASFFLFSCSGENANEEQVEETKTEEVQEEKAKTEVIALLDGGFKLSIEVPTAEIAGGPSQVTFHEDLGKLEVKVGNTYDLFIMEDESQMALMKNEINAHPFYKAEITHEDADGMIYRYYTEDGAKEEWHFYAEKKMETSTLLIRSAEQQEFSEYEVKKMFESAKSIAPF